jgi:hypothetical protein
MPRRQVLNSALKKANRGAVKTTTTTATVAKAARPSCSVLTVPPTSRCASSVAATITPIAMPSIAKPLSE